ncbi:hypothetical protein BOTCAL_0034g00250 [Botryotinia calthae]|uniref:Uncharacterized protein n=1 Tax=Botryotinia calthae TaxID=38488 RepID=A0A4Y8DD34_9HELO|nr:hypothetical protein BOTCAL_0034g00250 [Botryotinia calthae]
MLDFCLRLFCPGPGRRQKRERYTNPASLALSRPRRRYPLPKPVYPLPAPIIPPLEQNYEQPRPISSIYYPEPDLEFGPESELFHSQRFQRVPLDPGLRHRLEPAAQQVHFVDPEQEVYLPLPRPRSPPRQHIHFVQQLPPPYIPSPPPSPTTHHIHILPPPAVLPAPRQFSPPHTHIHLLGPVPPPQIATPPAQALALIPIPKVKRKMNFPNHPHPHQHPNPHHHHNHNHNHRHRSPSTSPSRSRSPLSHAHHPPHNQANNQHNNPNNLNNIPLADLIRDVLHRYLQINLPPGTAISIARLLSNSRNPNANLNIQANAGLGRNRSRSPSQGGGQGRGRRGGNNSNGNGAANVNVVGNGRKGNGGNKQAVMSSDSSSDSSDPPTRKSKTDLNEEIRRVNMCAQVANGIISPSMLDAEVHPKLDGKGQYSKGFQRPLKVRDFMAMDTKTLDALLITYDVSRVTHHSSDLAALSIFRAHNERNQNAPNHGARNPPCDCTICALVHEEQREARREILFEYLCVGALHGGSGVGSLLSLVLGHAQGQGHGQAQAQAQAQVQLTQAGGALIAGNPGGGGRRGGGGNHGANANSNANAAGYLILPQPGHAMQVQNVQGAVPNRLNNNNIGLAQPSQHAAHSHHLSQHLGGGGNVNGQGGLLKWRPGPYYPTTTVGYPIISKYVTTADGTITSVNHDGESKSTICVYPTGTGNERHCTVATYENDIVIDVNIVHITIIVIDGFQVTKTVTVTDSIIYTPTPPIQTMTTPPCSTGTGESYGKIHHVTVGDKGLNVYSPNQINANIGDIIRFEFLARTTPLLNPILTPLVISMVARMVLGINPAGKFDAFLEKAKNSGNSTVISFGTGYISGVPAPTDAYPTKTRPWITGVPSPSGYPSTPAQEATYTPVYKYPSIKRRSVQA